MLIPADGYQLARKLCGYIPLPGVCNYECSPQPPCRPENEFLTKTGANQIV